jgi:hypothetical protein
VITVEEEKYARSSGEPIDLVLEELRPMATIKYSFAQMFGVLAPWQGETVEFL